MKNLTAWDLSDLYRGINDKKINETLKVQRQKALTFQKKYRGKLSAVVKNAKSLLLIFKVYEQILIELVKPIHFAELLFAECGTDPKRGAFLQKTKKDFQEINNYLIFFEIELANLPEKLLKQLIKDKMLINYQHFLERLLQSKKHKLNEREEQLLGDFSLSGKQAFIRQFDEAFAHKKFTFEFKGKKQTLTETEVLHLLYSNKQTIRKAAAETLTVGLKEESRVLTYITNTLIQDKITTDRYRHFENPEASRHFDNDTNKKAVDVMCSVVTDNYDLVQDFYKHKAKLLGVKKLYDYDRYAPIEIKTKTYSVAEARTLVLDSFYSFSQTYGDIAKEFFDKNWIDFEKRPGKRGGAFCSYVTPDLHPYVFMNFNGSLRDVKTLAHELGHGIHGYLMRDLSQLNFDVPLTLAETASVFAEILLFDHLRNEVKNKAELQALYVHKLENSFATCFRQISMFLFERDLHAAYISSGEQRPEQINAIWRKRQLEMFGNSIILTPDYDCWWSYIPHFIHTPFYVYAYAFGELLTLGLYAQYKMDGDKFVPKYFNFLSQGGSQTPETLLKPLGVNLESRKFWQSGIDNLKEFMQNLKKTTA